MKFTTTFTLLREAGACIEGYRKLAKHLGGVDSFGADTEINLLTILESNGFPDAVWSLRATVQNNDTEKRLLACDFAESVLHIFESSIPGDLRPRQCIEAARKFSNSEVSNEELVIFRSAAHAAAYAAYAAYAAAAYAAYAAADAAYAAAAYAAYAAADAAADSEKEKLIDILKRHLIH